MARADRRRADRGSAGPKRPPSTARAEPTATARIAWPSVTANGTLVLQVAFVIAAGVFLVALARALEARITWYLAVDQFGYLQFAHDLLQGRIFHEWEPARVLGILPKRTDILAQTYIWDEGRMYCRYSPGFPMLVAAWIGLFGDERVAYLNPTVFLTFLALVMACTWRLTGSAWRGLAAAVLIALCPSRTYWWSLTLTRDLASHLFAFIGLYQLVPRRGAPLGVRRAAIATLAIGFAATVRNDAVLYLIPATLLVGAGWLGDRATPRRAMPIMAAAAAGLVLGLAPLLYYNAITTGNPLRPTQGVEVEQFLVDPTAPEIPGAPRIGYPPGLWKGTAHSQVSGGGLKLAHFSRTAPQEWRLVSEAYGPVLLGFAALGVITATILRPMLLLFAVPYSVAAFLLYSCWFKADPRYIIGVFTMVPLLIVEGVVGSVDLVHRIAERRGDGVARPIAAVLALVGVLVAAAPIPPPPVTMDAAYLSKNVLPVLMKVLPLATALGAAALAFVPSRPVTQVLAPALAFVLVCFGVVRADATRPLRAPFQGPQARLARETIRKTLEPRSVVITSEDMGRPAENIEYYGGFPALYLTDLVRWKIKASRASQAFISAGMRPYLLLDRPASPSEREERKSILADLEANGFVAEKVLDIPLERKMAYFIAAPRARPVGSELFRISAPEWEYLIRRWVPPR